jgi:hypothetical protein
MASEQEKKWIKNNWLGNGKSSRRNTSMNKNKYQMMSLYQLNILCQNENPDAISEWKRRFETDYPNIAKINKAQGELIIPYIQK